jgi:probable phosphoglycerate mutase
MTAPTRICVTRHGETDWNVAGILQGWLDVALNERGREQARALAAAFAATGFTSVYTSPLRRSLETAEIIADRLRLARPVCHDGLKERNFGVVQGIPKAELADADPVLLQHILKRDPSCSFEQGEGMDEFATRVVACVADIAARDAGGCVLAVTHGWTFDVVTRQARGLPRNTILHVKPKNGECLWLAATAESMWPLPAAG